MLHSLSGNAGRRPTPLSTYDRSSPLQVESTEGNLPLQLLTEPYVNLSIHTALVIQPPNAKHANEKTIRDLANTIPVTNEQNVFYAVADAYTYALPT